MRTNLYKESGSKSGRIPSLPLDLHQSRLLEGKRYLFLLIKAGVLEVGNKSTQTWSAAVQDTGGARLHTSDCLSSAPSSR